MKELSKDSTLTGIDQCKICPNLLVQTVLKFNWPLAVSFKLFIFYSILYLLGRVGGEARQKGRGFGDFLAFFVVYF